MAKTTEAAAGQTPFEAALAAGQKNFENFAKAFKGGDQLTALGKDNLQAVARANAAAVTGADRINKEILAYAQRVWTANQAAAKNLAGAKTAKDVVELNQGYVESAVERALAENAKLANMATAVANDVAEPLQAQAKITVETLLKPVAV